MFFVKYGDNTNEAFRKCHVERAKLEKYSKYNNQTL